MTTPHLPRPLLRPLFLVCLILLANLLCPVTNFGAAGTVIAWGDNTSGQTNVPPDLTNAVAVAAGASQSLAIRQDGTVCAWGGSSAALTNLPAGLTNVVQVAGGGTHSLALRADGSVIGWGDNFYPDTNSPTGQATPPAGVANATAIAAGWAHSVALRYDRTVIAWGYNGSGQTNVPANLGPAMAVAAGDWFSAALRIDGTVVAWGTNNVGQTNVPVGLSNVVAVAARGSTMLALKQNGSVVAWGGGSLGQTNVPADLTNAVAIAAGNGFELALRDDGRVTAWGDNSAAQIDGAAGLAQMVGLAAGGAHGMALLGDGSPQFTLQPRNQFAWAGSNVTFAAKAVGDSPLSYQWLKGGLILTNSTKFAGATAPTLTITNIATTNAGGYSLVISNVSGSVTSAVATLTILNPAVADSFNAGANNSVYSLAAQQDGKILLGGSFSSLGGQTRLSLGRLNADGTLNTNFNLYANGSVNCLVEQADGKIVVGGTFITLSQSRNYLGRLDAAGGLDMAFNPGANNFVHSLAVQADGKLLVGGAFTSLGGQTRNYIGRLNVDGSLDSGFNPGASYNVYSLAVQADGKVLVGGSFTTLAGQSRSYLGRLTADGGLDTTFNLGANSAVYSFALQADGKILVGGSFTTLGGQTRKYIGRLNADGSLDTSFNPGANDTVYSLAVQADGRILVGGDFFTLGGKASNRIGRLNADGSLDTTFSSGTSGSVYAIVVQADGKVLVGGNIGILGGQTRNGLGRLSNTEPARESLTFSNSTVTWLRSGTGPEVRCTAFDASTNGRDWTSLGAGVRILGGWQQTGLSFPTNAILRARGFAAGERYNGSTWFVESFVGAPIITQDPTSVANFTNTVLGFSVTAIGAPPLAYQWYKNGAALTDATNSAYTIQNSTADDPGSYQVVLSNAFGVVTSAVATFTISIPAVLDSFNPGVTGSVYSLSPQADGKIIVGGPFSALGRQTRNYIGRLNGDGTVDTVFNPGANYSVFALAAQDDGKIVVGGLFGMLAGQLRLHIGRLNPDGTLDTAPNLGTEYFVESVVVQPDGKIVVVGSFETLGGQAHYCIGRLNADGSVDTTFNPAPNSSVYTVALQADGKILIGGVFSTVGGQTRNEIARLYADGSLDMGFNPGGSGPPTEVNALAVQPDGKILVGGSFSSLGGHARSNIGRLNSDGTLDTTFNPGTGGQVWSIAIQANGKILVGGSFGTLGGQTRSGIGRLNSDGTLDATFNPAANGTVYSLGLQADGKILVGGSFRTLGGQSRTNIARLSNTEPATESLTSTGSTIIWLRGGTGPGFWRTAFDASTNGTDWVSLGAGSPIAGGWQVTGTTIPTNATVRARGYVTGGYDNDSSWYLESGLGAVVISQQPASRTNSFGTPAQLVALGAGTPPLSYQWCKSGVPLSDAGNLSGAQTASLTLTNVLGADAGGYSVIISNSSGSVTSQVATLTVVDPAITTQPVSRTNSPGTTAAFSVQAAGTPLLGYQWYRDGVGLEDGGNASGAHTATLTLSNAMGGDSGSYWITVSNALGSVTSVVATLTVNDPFITSQPASQAVSLGQTFGFSVAATGTAPAYQWRRDGVALPGATGTALAVTNAQRVDAGLYDVVVSSDFGSVTSTVAMLTLNLANADSLNPSANSGVLALAVQADGEILVGGGFTLLGGQGRSNIGRLKADGTLDATFDPGALGNYGVGCFAVQPDGRILVGGGFVTLGGQARQFYGQLNSDGSLDSSFSLVANGGVTCLLSQTDGKILMSGGFNTLGTQPRSCLARLNADSTLEATFNPGANANPTIVAFQPDGRILVGGWFTTLGGQTRNYIGRLNADGSLDASFNPGANNPVSCLAVQPDGKILVAGAFTSLGGQTRNYIGRLNNDGTLDNAFNPGANDVVNCLALQTDGKILAGGRFTVLGGQTRNRLGRLDAKGAPDCTFDPGSDNTVNALAVQADGKILVGGSFTALGGQARAGIGRLRNTDPANQTLSFDGANITWLRAGSSPEVWRTSFDASGDGTNWVSLGQGMRIPGGWQVTNVSVPISFTIRARGYVESAAYYGASSWLVETRVQLRPEVFATGCCSNQFGASIRAVPDQAVVIEASANFVSWTPIQTNVVSSSGVIYFTDPESGQLPHRFYRARYHVGSLPVPAIGPAGGAFGFQTNRFGFGLSGIAGQTVVIEASTNLAVWSALATNTLGLGPLYFSDPSTTNFPQRFYRAVLLP
jgi:uncharacterized delta-60 repeat protein